LQERYKSACERNPKNTSASVIFTDLSEYPDLAFQIRSY
jgi:hypothetical protein